MHFLISVIRPWSKASWGDWGPWRECAPGHRVQGVQLKIEARSRWRDNSGLNAIRLTCSDGEVLVSAEGGYGDWGHYVQTENEIVTVWLRAEDPLPDG